nr:hypothetical protein [Candidatus Sigynarchaeota archaeon]
MKPSTCKAIAAGTVVAAITLLFFILAPASPRAIAALTVERVAPAEAENSTVRLWGGYVIDTGHGVWGDGTGNIYTCGSTESFAPMWLAMVLVKWNSEGNQIWNRTWGEIYDVGRAVWGDGKGSIYTCGSTDRDTKSVDLLLVKWDIEGNQLWNRTWGGAAVDEGAAVWGDGTGSIYTCGDTYSFSAGGNDLVLVKWDSDGYQIWNRTWGGIKWDQGYGVWGDGTGIIYTCGSTMSFGSGGYDVVLVNYDSLGNQLWNRTWGGIQDDYGNAVWGDGKGSIYTCGDTCCYGAGENDMVLIKWNSAGNQVWNRTWGGSAVDEGSAVWGDGAGSIYTCGSTDSYGAGYSDIILVKWDAAGNRLWNGTWGGPANDVGNAMWGIGKYIYICGCTYSYGSGDTDMVLWFSELYTPIPTSSIVGIIVLIGVVAIAITLGIARYKKLPHRVKERARREPWVYKIRRRPKVKEIVYRRPETHAPEKSMSPPLVGACQNCGQRFPAGFERAAFCPYCGHATKQTSDKTEIKL